MPRVQMVKINGIAAGDRSGRLEAIRQIDRRLWEFSCDCGTLVEYDYGQVMRGNTRSCGCLHRETAAANCIARSTHKASKTPTYRIWEAMHRRCTYPSQQNYRRYGGKGIRVCERWNSFENFLADMGERPDDMSIDRFPNRNGDYEPANCRWATDEQQKWNKDSLMWIEWRGEIKHVTEWAKITGFNVGTLRARINRGLSPEDALTRKINGNQGYHGRRT